MRLLALFILSLAMTASAADEPEKLRRFEKEIRAFEAADAKDPPPKGAVLFLGSSSIRLWTTLAEDFPGVTTINRGFGGSTIADSVRYAERIVIPYEPKTVVFYAGDNDIASGRSPEKVLADYKGLVEKVRAKLPETRFVFISIKPSTARWKFVEEIREANRLVKEFSNAAKNLKYADVFTPMLGGDGLPRKELLRDDGLHMTRQGYEIWRNAIRAVLDKGKD